MTDIPVWLLDVDGVVNAPTAPSRKPPLHIWRDWIDTHGIDLSGGRWRIVAAMPVIDFIKKIHDEGRAEIRWHTTWQDAANRIEGLGLPEFPVQDAPEFADQGESLARGHWWKLPAVWRVISNEGRRVLWTDDDAAFELTRPQKSYLAGAGCHIISPSTDTGLTPKHLRAIGEYL